MLEGEYDPDADTERLGMKVKFKIAKPTYTLLSSSPYESLVIKNTDDGQKAYAAIIEHYFGGSSHACVVADTLCKAINKYEIPIQSRRNRSVKEYIREFLDMIWDYQESAPKKTRSSVPMR